MKILPHALRLAELGFKVFPLSGKVPTISEFPEVATSNKEGVRRFFWDPVFEREHPFNVGIHCGRYGKDEWLLVVDVDNKGEKRGSDELFKLELDGKTLPKTLTQETPTGGYHYIFKTDKPSRNRVGLFPGIDVRGRGGFIVGAGSRVDAGQYKSDWHEIADAPSWLVHEVGTAAERGDAATETLIAAEGVDQERAMARATQWLKKGAELAVEGAGGDKTTFDVCCKLKDFGIDKAGALEALLDHWNERCSPPWNPTDLEAKIQNAWRYGQDTAGALAPEAVFEEVVEEDRGPIIEMNETHAFVVAGGGSHILWETQDAKGKDVVEHLSIDTFHKKYAAHTMQLGGGGRPRPVTEVWMKDHRRRSYDRIVFVPGQEVPENFYNLWRGFNVEPSNIPRSPKAKAMFDRFMEHGLENICGGDKKLFTWLMGYFAHMVQKPWEKPQTAIVFRGGKGVGKNAFIERIGHLIKTHYMLTAERRYLVGNFNGHLQNLLLFVLDEAFWSGDKQAEGTIKHLVTGTSHIIEHKGKEPYSVDNCLRLIIMGNDDWVVAASNDERRFAVFNIGEKRAKQDKWFHDMRVGMDEEGGAELLLDYLLNFDLSKVNVNQAPETTGLFEQKIQSLNPLEDWWFNSLSEGEVLGGPAFDGGKWPRSLSKSQVLDSFQGYLNKRHIRKWVEGEQYFTKRLRKMSPSTHIDRIRDEQGTRHRKFIFPILEEARKEFETYIGHEIQWN